MRRETRKLARVLARGDWRVVSTFDLVPMATEALATDAENKRLRAQHAVPLTTRGIKPSDKRLLLCSECGGRCGARVSFCSHVGRVVAAVEFRRAVRKPAKRRRK